jgi:hypothetical protein
MLLPAHGLQEYDPLTVSLADALQVLATKSRWATSKAARQATLAAAEAVAEAAAAEEAGEEAGEEGAGKKKRGRPGKAALKKKAAASGTAGASISAAVVAAKVAEAAAEGGGREAAMAHVEARLALDAAAAVEIGRLQEALGLGDAADVGPQTAEQSRAAQASQNRGPTAFNIFYRREAQQGTGAARQRDSGTARRGPGLNLLAAQLAGWAGAASPCLKLAG